jgi:FAD/FMN-containing dehydrogenase
MLKTAETALALIAGEANLSTDLAGLHSYGIDGREPGVLIRPSNAAEISEILRFCAEAKLAAVVAGAGTKLRIGLPPARYDLALATTRLDRVLAYDPGDLTLSVEPGVALAAIQALLAQHRQFLPLAVPFSSQTTMGGAVASGIDSPLRQRYGTGREFLLGLEFVTGDGTPVRAGGRVVKNVAGYDLHKLLIGSLGTLGAITRLNFKTFPLPETFAGYLAAFGDEGGALELAARLRRSKLEPSAIELLSPELARLLAESPPAADPQHPIPDSPAQAAATGHFGGSTGTPACALRQSTQLPAAPHHSQTAGSNIRPKWPATPASGWLVSVGYGGSEAVLKRYKQELDRMASEAGATQAGALQPGRWQEIWDSLRETIPLILQRAPGAMIAKASVLPARMKPMLAAAREAAERHELKVALAARAVGVIYAAFLAEKSDEETLGRLALAASEWMDAAVAAEGFAWIPWCPAELKSRINLWGREREDLPLMKKLKAVFDPQAVLSPGRFAGGL